MECLGFQLVFQAIRDKEQPSLTLDFSFQAVVKLTHLAFSST